MNCLQRVMENHNPYLAAYRLMAEVEREELLKAEREGRKPSVVKMYLRMGPFIMMKYLSTYAKAQWITSW